MLEDEIGFNDYYEKQRDRALDYYRHEGFIMGNLSVLIKIPNSTLEILNRPDLDRCKEIAEIKEKYPDLKGDALINRIMNETEYWQIVDYFY